MLNSEQNVPDIHRDAVEMPSRIHAVQECDARDDASPQDAAHSTTAGQINYFLKLHQQPNTNKRF